MWRGGVDVHLSTRVVGFPHVHEHLCCACAHSQTASAMVLNNELVLNNYELVLNNYGLK